MSMYLDADKFMDWIVEMVTTDDNRPYIDKKLSKTVKIRTFDPNVTDSDEYVWHRDTTDRKVTVLEGHDWKFQFDGDIPKTINIGEEIYIKKHVYHRIIAGNGLLKIKIEEVY